MGKPKYRLQIDVQLSPFDGLDFNSDEDIRRLRNALMDVIWPSLKQIQQIHFHSICITNLPNLEDD